jgi:predicted Zn finger-like uncharacterized protein
MKFVCERCHTRYSIADDKVRQKILKIRCKTCENVITVREPSAAAAVPAAAAPAARPAAPAGRAAPPLPPGAREWFVAINGTQAGPMTRPEAAQRIVAGQPDDEIYVWKEDLDGWKEPKDVPAILHEVNALRSLEAPTPSSRPPAPPPSMRPQAAGKGAPARSGGARPTGKHAPLAAKAGAPGGRAAASLAQAAPSFDEEDRTQISALDASWLASDVAPGRTTGNRAAVLPFSGKGAAPAANGAEAAAAAALDGLFRDAPPASSASSSAMLSSGAVAAGYNGQGSGGIAARPGFSSGVHSASGLSAIGVRAGFLTRNPSFKFLAAAAVVVVLVGLAWVVLQDDAPTAQPPSPAVASAPPATAPKPPPIDEEKTRREAEKRFQSSVDVPPAARPEREAKKPARPAAKPERGALALAPAPLQPGSFTPESESAAAARRMAGNERKVPELSQNRGGGGGGAASAPTDVMISAVVSKRENMAAIKACYDRALKRNDRLRSGRIDVKASVGMSGMVKQVVLYAPSEFSPVESCIRMSVKRWTFPPNMKEYEVEFPLLFQGTL